MKYIQRLKCLQTGFIKFSAFTMIQNLVGKNIVSLSGIRLYETSIEANNTEGLDKIRIESEIDSTKTKKRSSPKPRTSTSSFGDNLQDEKYFNEIKDLVPSKLLKRKRSIPEGLYLMNKETAYDILFPILPFLQTPASARSTLIEINPGLGYLTDLILSNWSREILLYEHNRQFANPLNDILENHRGRVHIKYENFYDIWKLAYQDKHDQGQRVKSLFGEVKPEPWGRDFCSTIIGSSPSIAFLKHLIHSLVFQYSIMMLGRHQMFFIVTPSQYVQLTCTRDIGYRQYRTSTIMFQILFKYKWLCKVPRKSFLPWVCDSKPGNTMTAKLRNIDSEYLYLMRIEPRANLYEYCKPEDLKQLWYFIRHNCLSRKNRIIPVLERWAPNCGPRLIIGSASRKVTISPKTMKVDGFNVALESAPLYEKDYFANMTIFTEFGDLNPSQLLTLFKQFKSWPEFSESTFITSMENMLLKMENAQEIIDDVEAEDEQEETVKNNEKD